MSADIYGFVFVRFENTEKEKLITKVSECPFEEFDQVAVWDESNYALIADYQKSDNDVSIWLPEGDEIEELFDGGTNILKTFSEDFAEVIAFYTIDDYYHYQHWVNGNLERILEGNDDGTDYSLGTEEAWENECFSSVKEAEEKNEHIILVDAMNKAITNFYNLRPLYFKDANKTVFYSKN